MAFKNYRDESRANYGRDTDAGGNMRNDELRLGALLRIADASEAMAKNHVKLIEERDYLKRRVDNHNNELSRLHRQRAALRGQITRLKKKLAAKEESP